MKIAIPVNRDNNNIIESMNNNPLYLKIKLNSKSEIETKEYLEDYSSLLNYGVIDYLIVNSQTEPTFIFLEYNIFLLQAEPNNNIDEIIEAFRFKELKEIL